jgi:hypothetical protein
MRVPHHGKGGDPKRAVPARTVAAMNWLIDALKGAVALAWYAVLLVAPFWLLRLMLRDLLGH